MLNFTLNCQAPAIIIFLALPLLAQEPPAPATATEPARTEYGGPAILSRGATSSLLTPGQNVRIRPYVSVSGTYDTGITPVVIRRDGKLVNDASPGAEAEFGLLGYYRWKNASLGLDYRGNYRH